MITIIREGKVYQIERSYLVKGKLLILIDYNEKDQFVFVDGPKKAKHTYIASIYKELIVTSKYTTGTIEDAPLELENGFWYMCEKTENRMPYEVPYEVPYFYFNGFKSNSNSQIWFSVLDSGAPLYKMGKAENKGLVL